MPADGGELEQGERDCQPGAVEERCVVVISERRQRSRHQVSRGNRTEIYPDGCARLVR